MSVINDIRDPEVCGYLDSSSQQPLEIARAILLFGKNSATYKFALAKTLLSYKPESQASYSDIGEPFLRHLVEHHKLCPHQYNRGGTALSKAIDNYLQGQLSWDALFDLAERSIYNNVFDAFHVIGGGKIGDKYSLFEHVGSEKKIVFTEQLNSLQSCSAERSQLLYETDARWRVVEEAWRDNISPMLVLDERDKLFYTKVGDFRINLRSAVSTLMPYQLGRCFYCRRPLDEDADRSSDEFPDVDHVLPLSLLVKEKPGRVTNPNGVWNLVLACRQCNRGAGGKRDIVPHEKFYESLVSRNLYFTKEHKHSMRYSVLKSLGASTQNDVRTRMVDLFQPFRFFPKWSPDV